MRKYLLTLTIFTSQLILIGEAHAGEIFESAPGVLEIAGETISFIFKILAILAVIGTVLSGVMYITASGNPQRMEKAKKYLNYAITGTIIALGSFIIMLTIERMLGGEVVDSAGDSGIGT